MIASEKVLMIFTLHLKYRLNEIRCLCLKYGYFTSLVIYMKKFYFDLGHFQCLQKLVELQAIELSSSKIFGNCHTLMNEDLLASKFGSMSNQSTKQRRRAAAKRSISLFIVDGKSLFFLSTKVPSNSWLYMSLCCCLYQKF